MKIIGNKSKNRQLGLYQTKKFCMALETINRAKRQPLTLEEILVSHIVGKRVISKKYKELTQLNYKNITPFKNVRSLNFDFSKEDIKMTGRHIKRYSTSLIIRKI